MVFKHETKDLKVRGDKNHVDENVSEHGISRTIEIGWPQFSDGVHGLIYAVSL